MMLLLLLVLVITFWGSNLKIPHKEIKLWKNIDLSSCFIVRSIRARSLNTTAFCHFSLRILLLVCTKPPSGFSHFWYVIATHLLPSLQECTGHYLIMVANHLPWDHSFSRSSNYKTMTLLILNNHKTAPSIFLYTHSSLTHTLTKLGLFILFTQTPSTTPSTHTTH